MHGGGATLTNCAVIESFRCAVSATCVSAATCCLQALLWVHGGGVAALTDCAVINGISEGAWLGGAGACLTAVGSRFERNAQSGLSVTSGACARLHKCVIAENRGIGLVSSHLTSTTTLSCTVSDVVSSQ